MRYRERPSQAQRSPAIFGRRVMLRPIVLADFAAHVNGATRTPAPAAAQVTTPQAAPVAAPAATAPTPAAAPMPANQADAMARRRALRQQGRES